VLLATNGEWDSMDKHYLVVVPACLDNARSCMQQLQLPTISCCRQAPAAVRHTRERASLSHHVSILTASGKQQQCFSCVLTS
jgi:hypothetical protein